MEDLEVKVELLFQIIGEQFIKLKMAENIITNLKNELDLLRKEDDRLQP